MSHVDKILILKYRIPEKYHTKNSTNFIEYFWNISVCRDAVKKCPPCILYVHFEHRFSHYICYLLNNIRFCHNILQQQLTLLTGETTGQTDSRHLIYSQKISFYNIDRVQEETCILTLAYQTLVIRKSNFVLLVYRCKCESVMSWLSLFLVRVASNGTNMGIFKISFSTFWIGELNKPHISTFGANLTQFGYNPDFPVVSINLVNKGGDSRLI